MKRCLLALLILTSLITITYADMSASYQAGENFGTNNEGKSQGDAQNPSYGTVPNYQGTNVPQTQYSGDLNAEARQAMANGTDPIGTSVNQSINQNPEQPADSNLINKGNSITEGASSGVNQSSLFCHDASCTDTTYRSASEGDLGENASALSALIAAGSDDNKYAHRRGFWWNKHWVYSMQSFIGSGLGCRDMGFINDGLYDNCCADKGWGQVIGLAGCNQEEKTLGEDKQNDLCVYVGEYCSDKTLGICNEHKKTYCCYHSILAKVIEEQGRPQIGLDFGSADSPNCSGLTPTELQRIDFSRIDFSEYYASLQAKMHIPDSAEVDNQIASDMQEMFNSGNPS